MSFWIEREWEREISFLTPSQPRMNVILGKGALFTLNFSHMHHVIVSDNAYKKN